MVVSLLSAPSPLRCGAVVGLRWFGLQVVEDRIDLALQADKPRGGLAFPASRKERDAALERGDAGLELGVVTAAVRVVHARPSSSRTRSRACSRRSSARKMLSSTAGVQPGTACASSGCARTHSTAAARIVWTPRRSKMPGGADTWRRYSSGSGGADR